METQQNNAKSLILDNDLMNEWFKQGVNVLEANTKYVIVQPATGRWVYGIDFIDKLERMLNADLVTVSSYSVALMWRT
jgi:hypothetical protein